MLTKIAECYLSVKTGNRMGSAENGTLYRMELTLIYPRLAKNPSINYSSLVRYFWHSLENSNESNENSFQKC